MNWIVEPQQNSGSSNQPLSWCGAWLVGGVLFGLDKLWDCVAGDSLGCNLSAFSSD